MSSDDDTASQPVLLPVYLWISVVEAPRVAAGPFFVPGIQAGVPQEPSSQRLPPPAHAGRIPLFRPGSNSIAGQNQTGRRMNDHRGQADAMKCLRALGVAIANGSGNDVSILRGTGDGALGGVVRFGAGEHPVSLVLGHLDGDGVLDLVVANASSGDIVVLRGRR